VRPALFVAAATAIAAIAPAEARGVLATAASALLEATPFLLAARLLARFCGAHPHAIAYLGCGCGSGPSARSLPAAAATWVLFGPAVAIARLAAAIAVARLLHARDRESAPCARRDGFLDDLAAMTAPALLAGIATQVLPFAAVAHANPIAAALGGAILGFAAAPCALGGVALSGALHAQAPLACAAFLCVAGVVDARALATRAHRGGGNDAFAYLLTAAALGTVAVRGGDALVHPVIAGVLGAASIVHLALFTAHRRERSPAARIAPAIMLAGVLAAAPPPIYRATETTLGGAFPGERVTFLGTLVRDASHDALVRYAIVCCRADATPVVVRLASRAPFAPGTWLRGDGAIVEREHALLFAPATLQRVAPPLDPFVYR
jgi:hypothetical protein